MEGAQVAAFFAAAAASVVAVLSLGAVLARWPGRWWWVAVPAATVVLGIVRLDTVPFA